MSHMEEALPPIQYENRHPDELVIPEFRVGLHERIITPNGNYLGVHMDLHGISIADPRAKLDPLMPLYIFAAYTAKPHVLQAFIRSRGPGDWPHRKHPDIRPEEQLRQSLGYFDRLGKPIRIFRATWEAQDSSHNTNALIFNRFVEDPANASMDPIEREEAAIQQTPTGKVMTRLGFVPHMGSLIVGSRGQIDLDFELLHDNR